jgi:transmembrane sensor
MRDSLQIEEIGAGWLARRDGECWSAGHQMALTAWLGAATAHRVAYIRLEAAWQKSRRPKILAASAPTCMYADSCDQHCQVTIRLHCPDPR